MSTEQVRRRAVEAARHSTAMEGGRCSEQATADQDAYVRGEITVDELIGRAGRASVATDPMPDRTLFYAATPEAAYLIVRDQALPNPAEPVTGEAGMVELVARRGGCPGGTAVAVTVNEQDLRPGVPSRPGSFLVPREAITPTSIGRTFQPWHADVEPDPHQRWKGYLQPNSALIHRFAGGCSGS